MTSPITTHVLDTARGKPAADVPIALDRHDGALWQPLGSGRTDGDGRLRDLLPSGYTLATGLYRLSFDTGAYFAAAGREAFYPEVQVIFRVSDGGGAHYHVPLLLSPFGYSTYRGS